jgi:hypothetical protein
LQDGAKREPTINRILSVWCCSISSISRNRTSMFSTWCAMHASKYNVSFAAPFVNRILVQCYVLQAKKKVMPPASGCCSQYHNCYTCCSLRNETLSATNKTICHPTPPPPLPHNSSQFWIVVSKCQSPCMLLLLFSAFCIRPNPE